MKDNQSTNTFDAMLKQSLESAQMPVPTGVWESVGSSLGAKAIITAKVASIKLLVLKSVAGIVLAGGAVFGVYELLKPDAGNTLINNPITDNRSSSTGITQDTIFPSEIKPSDINISKSRIQNPDILFYKQPESDPVSQKPLNDTVIKVIKNNEPEINEPVIKPEPPVKKVEIKETKKEDKKEIPKEEPVENPVFQEPPNVFTPNGDNLNDIFKIEVENEKMFFLQIFDDEGKKVFETTDKNMCWDGKNRNTGEMCKKGIYKYKYMYELNTGFKKTATSWLTLL